MKQSPSVADSQPEENLFLSLPSSIRASLNAEQSEAVQALLSQAQKSSTPSAKVVDLRFVIDLVITRYFFVLLVGRDQRSQQRASTPNRFSRVGNVIAVILLLLGLNLLVTSFVFLGLYLTKSALGIDLFPGHLGQPPTEELLPDPLDTN